MPPSINEYWRDRVVFSKERECHIPVRYVTHEGKDYQQTIRELMLERKAWYRSPHPLALRILCCFSNDIAHDLDNRVKVLQDALKNGNVILDDKQVKTLEVREGPKFRPSVVFVHLSEILPDPRANLEWIKNPGA